MRMTKSITVDERLYFLVKETKHKAGVKTMNEALWILINEKKGDDINEDLFRAILNVKGQSATKLLTKANSFVNSEYI